MNVFKLVRFVFLPIFILSFVALSLRAQQNDATTERAAQYFERIRFDEARSTQFFEAMPKGGDLHHHFSGAVYAEEMYEAARKQNFFVSRDSLFVYREMPPPAITRDTSIYRLSDPRIPSNIRTLLLNFWSVKDFVPGAESNEDHFFQSFGRFGPTIGGSESLFLQTIKKRAITENVQYIETMFLRPYFNRGAAPFPSLQATYDSLLERAERSHDSVAAHEYFLRMYSALVSDPQFMANARNHHENVVQLTKQSVLPGGEDSLVSVRYQNYVVRTVSPSDVFAQLMLSMASCDDSLILGVNIVAPEDNEIAMRDYWLHMQMFAFFHTKFPSVPDDLHAGELTLGVVKPEDLTWHIGSAVYTAGAKRIGHGVDMAYERESDKLLDYMHAHNIAIEINLASNEFILGVKGERHPFPLYEEHHVPIVLGTDDPGVLRTNLTHQFVLLASRYKEVTYTEIKGFVYNSINYSFLPTRDKQKLIHKLDDRFHVFESSIANKSGQ